MAERLAGRFIGLGVTGSIAAFKAVDLLRLLRAEGADVQVLMTPSAVRFVAPLTLAALSRRHVDAEVLDLLPDGRIGHVVTADAADAILVAPATAHWLGAMAHGLAADTVTATCLATSAPVVVAPAMDGDMWTHRATQDNVARLTRQRSELQAALDAAVARYEEAEAALVAAAMSIDRTTSANSTVLPPPVGITTSVESCSIHSLKMASEAAD